MKFAYKDYVIIEILSRVLHFLMLRVAFDVDCAEWARWAYIFASAAAYASSSIYYRE